VQRAAPFSLPPEDASGSTRALTASVPPARSSWGIAAFGAALLLAATALGGVVLAAQRGPSTGKNLARLQAAAPGLRAAEPAAELTLSDVAVKAPGKRRAARARPPKPRDCKQLYYTDSTGIRRVKRDCL
jgi:hypothetical protein